MPLPHLPTEVGEIVLDNAIAMLSRNCRRAGTVEHAVIYGEAMKALAGVSRFDAREVAGSIQDIIKTVDKVAQTIAKRHAYQGPHLRIDIAHICRVRSEMLALRHRICCILRLPPQPAILHPLRFASVSERLLKLAIRTPSWRCHYRHDTMLLSSSIDTFPCARALRRANAHRQAFPPAYPTYVLWDRIFRQALVPDSFARVLDTWHDYTPGSFEVAVKEVLALLTGLASVNRSAASRVLSYAGWDVRQLIERACHTASKDWHRCVPSRDGFRRTTLDAPYRMSDINHERWNPLLTVWEEELVQAHRQIKAFLRRLKEAIENIDQARFEERKRTAFYDDFLKVVTYNSYDWW